MKNGAAVAVFEREFAAYVGARYAIALCNGTATLHTALVALGIKPGDRVAVPPLTMASTTIAVLHAGAVPEFVDVEPDTWLVAKYKPFGVTVPVSLYGLHQQYGYPFTVLDDAAQTLRPHGLAAFTSFSFQASKILALGEGGMLVTDSEELATKAREFSSLGYRMRADQPRIDPATLKSPTFERHHGMGYNYRMNDCTASYGLDNLEAADDLLAIRREAAAMYRDAHAGWSWLTPQHVPEGWTHDYWTYAVAMGWQCDLADRIVAHGGERPYAAWRLTYQEPAFRHHVISTHPSDTSYSVVPAINHLAGVCPVAESLQPRLLQFQTNNLASAERNAKALRLAIRDIDG